MKLSFIFFLFFVTSCAQARVSVFYPKSQTEGSVAELVSDFPTTGYVIMGEYHNDPVIQSMEAELIDRVMKDKRKKGPVSVSWEFLDHTDQSKISDELRKFAAQEKSSEEFLKAFFTADHTAYVPIMEMIKKHKLGLFGINIPRSYKQMLIKDGIETLPEAIVPPNMSIGDENYLERFNQTMGGHVPQEKVARYFEAQCLTDSVMAFELSKRSGQLNFVIAGSFHTDYFSGTVSRLKELVAGEQVVVKIVNAKALAKADLEAAKSIHPKYGEIADAIVIID